jgi:hypothetical protein
VNWLCHFTLKIRVHFFLTAVLILSFSSECIWYGRLILYSQTGESSLAAQIFNQLFTSVYRLILFLTVLATATGWYIVRTDLPLRSLGFGALGAIIYVFTDAILANLELAWGQFVLLIIGLIGLILYTHHVYRALRIAANYVVAYLIVIQESGIAPMTTPVFRKYMRLRRYFLIVSIYCAALAVAVFFGLYLDSILWLPRVLDSIVDLYIAIALAWIFHFRTEQEETYINITDDAGEGTTSMISPAEFSPEYIERIGGADGLTGEGTPYESGMELPPRPRILEGVPAQEQEPQTL